MKPPEQTRRELVEQWRRKASQDLETAEHLLGTTRFHEAIAFHAQQAVEKYLKALLVCRQVEFPKTHDIGRLLDCLATFDPETAAGLRDADELTPFGVEMRYPSDAPELLPGEASDAVEVARRVKERVSDLLLA
jgi:HEPN domain-containing protein